MQILWWIAILSAATCVQASPLTKVIGGQITEPTEFPFIVSVQRRSFSSWSHLCAGTVYNELWIISNAHCLERFRTRQESFFCHKELDNSTELSNPMFVLQLMFPIVSIS